MGGEQRLEGPTARDQPPGHRVVVERNGHHPNHGATVGDRGRAHLEHVAMLGHGQMSR
jgi:hypothetical protein